MSTESDNIYLKLRKHLDTHPVGYPETKSGVEIRILKHLFSPKEAKIALKLNILPQDSNLEFNAFDCNLVGNHIHRMHGFSHFDNTKFPRYGLLFFIVA